MKKGLKILILLTVFTLITVPIASGMQTAESVKSLPKDANMSRIVCSIGGIGRRGSTITTELSEETIESIKELAESSKDSFMTIYNKYSTNDEVETAFEEIQPFFNALIDNGLTDKSVDELNELFYKIRGKIRKPRRNPFDQAISDNNGEQSCGNWNGIPTPLFGNVYCGLFSMGTPAIGFTLGTHTIIPTIGADLATTWLSFGFTGTIGTLGLTSSTGPEYGLILGFIGIMLATPILILGFILQVGFAAIYVGAGPSPI